MRTTIYIPDDLVASVKNRAWEERKSVSEYLVSCHLRNVDKKFVDEVKKLNEKKPPVAPQESNTGATAEISKVVSSDLDGNLKLEELSVRDKYKLKFPNQICPNCKEKNNNCKC